MFLLPHLQDGLTIAASGFCPRSPTTALCSRGSGGDDLSDFFDAVTVAQSSWTVSFLSRADVEMLQCVSEDVKIETELPTVPSPLSQINAILIAIGEIVIMIVFVGPTTIFSLA